jgi:hypothetical protein
MSLCSVLGLLQVNFGRIYVIEEATTSVRGLHQSKGFKVPFLTFSSLSLIT